MSIVVPQAFDQKVQSIISLQGSPVTVTNVAIDMNQGEVISSAIGTMQVLESWIAVVYKTIPGAGTALSAADFLNNLRQAGDQILTDGNISDL